MRIHSLCYFESILAMFMKPLNCVRPTCATAGVTAFVRWITFLIKRHLHTSCNVQLRWDRNKEPSFLIIFNPDNGEIERSLRVVRVGVAAEGQAGGQLRHDAERDPDPRPLSGLRLHCQGLGAQLHEGQASLSNQVIYPGVQCISSCLECLAMPRGKQENLFICSSSKTSKI